MAAYTDRPHLSEAHTKSQLYHPSHLGEALAELAIKSSDTFTPATHASLNQILYSTLLQASPSALPSSSHSLPRTASPNWPTFKLSDVQRDARKLDVKGKGKERYVGEAGTAGEKGQVGVGDLDKMGWRKDRCERAFERGDLVYRIKDVTMTDSLALLCRPCFLSSPYTKSKSLQLKISTGTGDFCSCGDSEIWGSSWPSSSSSACAHHHSTHPLGNDDDDNDRIDVDSEPDRELNSLQDMVATLLDYVLTTLGATSSEPQLPTNATAISSLARIQPSDLHPTETTALRQEQMMFKAGKSHGAGGGGGGAPKYAVVLWNDEKHTREDVAVQLGDAVGWDEHKGFECAERIHKEGRETILVSTDLDVLLHVAHTLAQVDLGVTFRPAKDVFHEVVSSHIVSFLLDVVGLEGTKWRRAIWNELRLSVRHVPQLGGPGGFGLGKATRFERLLLDHTKWWKRPRAEWGQLMGRMGISSNEVRLEMAESLSTLFPSLINSFLFTDRESDTSTLALTSKLFPIPSIAADIVTTRSHLSTYLLVLRSFYTNQFSHKRILLPPSAHVLRVEPDSEAFKMKKASPLFSHLKELLAAPGVQSWIASTPRAIEEILRLLAIFTEMNLTKRAAENHVEYESEAWIKAFQVSGDLGRVARLWSLSYADGTDKDLFFAIASTARDIYRMTTLDGPGLDSTKFAPPKWHQVHFGRRLGPFDVLDVEVQSEFMSFHHPMHWLLAGCLKLVDKMGGMKAEDLKDVLTAMLEGVSDWSEEERERRTREVLLILMDTPLKVTVYVAQLRNGLWVRNGQSMRQQHHHYREHTALGIREVAWDNDVFLLQVGLSILEPDTVLATFLDRFSLIDWFSGDMDHSVYAHPAAGMVEEFLLLLITCLTEPANLCAWSEERYVRREIIHALVLGPSTYSDLIKKLPERVNESVHLAPTIDLVANFRKPETNNDLGLYDLKEECFAEVDALFHHYSRNQKQEVEDLLERRFKKANGPKTQYLHIPKLMDKPLGPYANLALVYRSAFLPHIVYSTLWNLIPLHRLANKEGDTDGKTRESQESVLELGLHLAMLCLQAEPSLFAQVASTEEFVPDWTLVRLLCSIEDEELFKAIRPRVAWCLDVCKTYYEAEVTRWRVVPPPVPNKAPSAGATRKGKAAARQAAIMSRFTKDQQAFLEAHGDEDDDDMDLVGEDADIVYGACMVCQEECTSSLACGCLAMIQPSKLIRQAVPNQAFSIDDALLVPSSLDQSIESSALDHPNTPDAYPRGNFKFGLHTSTCGHLMHLECFEGYTKTTENRHHAQAARNHPENVARKEFNCPLCKSLGNVLLPMQNPYDRPTKPLKSDELPLRDWLRFINTEALRDVPDTSLMFTHRTETGELPPLYADSAQTVNVPEQEKTPLFESTRKMLDEFFAVVRPISQQSVHLRPKSLPEAVVQDRPAQGMYLPDELVAYTLAGIEVTQRGQASPGTSVADSLNGSTSQLLKCLLGSLRHATAFNLGGSQGLNTARYGLFARLLPDWYRDNKMTSALLLRDPLGILIEGAAIAFEYLQPILILTYYAELCRAVLGLLHLVRSFPGRPTAWLKTQNVDATEALKVFGNVKQLVRGMCAHSRILQFELGEYLLCLPDDVLARLLYAFTLPFLRRAAILHHVVKSTSAPTSNLLLPSEDNDNVLSTRGEYRRLMAHLRIPTPSSTLSPPEGKDVAPFSSAISDTVNSYLKQYSACYGPRSSTSAITLEYPSIYRLARLPDSLEGVFAAYGRRTCGTCRTVPAAMAVCLFCGEGVCVGVSCCREDVWGGSEGLGECNLHMRRCNAPIGIFLDLRKWQVLWLWAGTGSWGSNFYLDIHGELDQSMKRGFPQHLHPPRLDEIRKTWLTHAVPSFVARKMEALLDGGGWMSF